MEKREVQLYIKNNDGAYVLMDMFNAQTLSIKDSIKDIKDISRIFTKRSHEFKLPASDRNNQVFRHYENTYINNGFDGRVKRDAVININGFKYDDGQISMLGVDMKNNVPHSYRVVFYGKTISLKDLFGDDMLHDLARFPDSYLKGFDNVYDSDFVIKGLSKGWNLVSGSLVENTDSTAGDLCFPFISSKSYYFWDSTVGGLNPSESGVESRNLLPAATTTPRGLNTYDVKPAIRIKHIIAAIEERYGITFSTDFFDATDDLYNELYLWCHRTKGDMRDQVEQDSFSVNISDWDLVGGNTELRSADELGNPNSALFERENWYYEMDITVTPAGGSGVYDLEIFDAATGAISNSNPSSIGLNAVDGQQTFTFTIDGINSIFNTTQGEIIRNKPIFSVRTRGGITSFTLDSMELRSYQIINYSNLLQDTSAYTYNSGGSNAVSTGLNLVANLPKMKVIDFMTSLFKMFNLTVEFIDDILVVRTLDDFYADGTTYDITKYIDTSNGKINKGNLYSKILFEYQNPTTFAVKNSNQITNDEFGNEKLNNRTTDLSNPLAFDGGDYKVKLGFEHVMYERMTNQSDDDDLTDIGWGWMVNENQNPVLGKPLILFCKKEDAISQEVNIDIDDSGVYTTIGDTYDYSSGTGDYDSIIRPSNVLEDEGQTIHFGSEVDEYNYQGSNQGVNRESLFQNFYYSFIMPIYSIRSRIFKVTAHFPTHLLLQLRLNDKVYIGDRLFKINLMKPNLNTGKTELELLNEVETYSLVDATTPDPPSGDVTAPVIGTLSYISHSSGSVTLSITGTTDDTAVTSYDIYRDGVKVGSQSHLGDPQQMTVTGLSASTNYDFKVKAKDAAGNESAFSNTINQTTDGDTTAPVAVSITLQSKDDSSIYVKVVASDAVGIDQYDMYIDGALDASFSSILTTDYYSFEGLSDDTLYTLKFKARDAAGNISSYSPELEVTTDEAI